MIRAFGDRFKRRVTTATIGDVDGPEETTLALPWDAAVTPAGEVLILDRIQAVVRAFTVTGDYLYALGGLGEGPGEFQVPEAVLYSPAGDLIVVDQAQLIHRFGRHGDRFEYRDRGRFEGSAYDACLAGNQLVLHAMRPGIQPEILYRLLDDPSEEVGFAVPYRYSRPLAYEAVSRGQIACASRSADAGGVAVIAYRVRNAIEGYGIADGRRLWHARIDGLQPSEIRERREGRAVGTGIFDNEAVHFLSRVAGGNGVPVFVQHRFSVREDVLNRTGRHRIETYALDPQTGEGEFWGDSLPPMLAVTEDHAVFSYDNPYPRVEVARIPR